MVYLSRYHYLTISGTKFLNLVKKSFLNSNLFWTRYFGVEGGKRKEFR